MIYYANWKLNKNSSDVVEYFEKFNKFNCLDDICFFVSPPLLQTAKLHSKYKIGAQNVCYEDFGAFTGETSLSQALDFGVSSVLIGHSERRIKFFETDELLNDKLKLCSEKIECVLCIGENIEGKARKQDILEAQLTYDLDGVKFECYPNIIIAYEPVWAIGSGVTPTADEIERTIKFIKCFLKSKYEFEFKVLYGGSVDLNNIKEFKQIPSVDGFLIGGASLDAEKFYKLINA